MDEQTTLATQLREGIAALRGGDRPTAYAIFSRLTSTYPQNENAWIGLALSSISAAEAAAAVHQAERINPASRFVNQAKTDLNTRLPGFARALAAERGHSNPEADLPGALRTGLLTDEEITAGVAGATDGRITPPTVEIPAMTAEPVPVEASVVTPVPVGATRVLDETVVPAEVAATPANTAPVVAAAHGEAPAVPAGVDTTPALDATPRLGSGRPLQTSGDSRARRALLNLAVTLGALALIALIGWGLYNSTVFSPPPPATMTPLPSATPPAAPATPRATLAPPQVAVPPALTPVPGRTTVTETGAVGGTALPSPTLGAATVERQTAIDAVRAGRYAAAIPVLEITTERTPGDAEALYYLGIAYLNAPDRAHGAEEAALTFRSLQALHPTWSPGLDMLARSLMARGMFREAVTPAHQAVESDPSRSEYWSTLGQAYEGAGATVEAGKAYAEAARRSPTPPAGSGPAPATSSTPGFPSPPGTPGGAATPGASATATPTLATTGGGAALATFSATLAGGPTATPTAGAASGAPAPATASPVPPLPGTTPVP
ncbi:MAG TPA: tetratricopeptide repeat protein [Chloroflexia bacterium]|nr:tetratricopeptide repeat protein [Chloroflexia bacterium]